MTPPPDDVAGGNGSGRTAGMLGIDHVAAAVTDLDSAITGFEAGTAAEHLWTFESEQWLYRTAYLLAGTDLFTLIEPTDDDSFIATYLARSGPGLHHIGVNVADLAETMAAVTDAGADVIMETSIDGVRDEATIHPKTWFGLQVQFIEWHPDVGPSARDHVAAMQRAKERGLI